MAGIHGNQAAVVMRRSSQYWLIAKLSFIAPRRISRLRLAATRLLPFISYLIKKAEGAIDIMWSSMDTFLSCRLTPATEAQVWNERLDCCKAPLSHSFCAPHQAKEHCCTKKKAQNKEQLPVTSLCFHLGNKKKKKEKAAEKGRRAAGGERVTANSEKCHSLWGWGRNSVVLLVLTENLKYNFLCWNESHNMY